MTHQARSPHTTHCKFATCDSLRLRARISAITRPPQFDRSNCRRRRRAHVIFETMRQPKSRLRSRFSDLSMDSRPKPSIRATRQILLLLMITEILSASQNVCRHRLRRRRELADTRGTRRRRRRRARTNCNAAANTQQLRATAAKSNTRRLAAIKATINIALVRPSSTSPPLMLPPLPPPSLARCLPQRPPLSPSPASSSTTSRCNVGAFDRPLRRATQRNANTRAHAFQPSTRTTRARKMSTARECARGARARRCRRRRCRLPSLLPCDAGANAVHFDRR